MNDYNYELDIYTSNANALIAQRVTERSSVLEFGPAYGRLTKYLSEHKHCSVDIVELNPVAGKVAAQYSQNYCIGEDEGNIEKYLWENRLADNKYDYIIFADVLEHLRSPELVLKKCQSYLKDQGSILCSVPNIAHSSVILSLLNDDFTYKDYGLLDRTHISFFTRRTFRTLCKECGYQVVFESAIKSEVGTNEITYDYSSVSDSLKNALRFRENGEAYQYVFCLKKDSNPTEDSIINSLVGKGWIATCYFRKKEDSEFNILSKLTKHIYSLENDLYFKFNNISELEGIRLEPIDSLCLLKIEGLFWGINSKEVENTTFITNGTFLHENYFAFFNDFPQIYCTVPDGNIEYIRIKYKAFLYDDINDLNEIAILFQSYKNQYIDTIQKSSEKYITEINEYKKDIKAQEESILMLENEKAELHFQMKNLSTKDEIMQSEIQTLREKITAVNDSKERLKSKVSYYEKFLWNKLLNKWKK